MQVYISNNEITQIAEGLVQMLFDKIMPKRIDVDAIAKYLGLSVVYEQIAEEDHDKIGFLSDGVSPLSVFRDGRKVKVTFPKDMIVLEKFLLRSEEEKRRRFILAHEISHVLLGRADPMHSGACFKRVCDTERTYSINELRDRMSLVENQANAMAAIILMPRAVLSNAVQRHLHRNKIPVYGDCVFLPEMKPALQEVSDELCVSYTPMLIQLRKYGLLEQRDMHEYFSVTMRNGGESFADCV